MKRKILISACGLFMISCGSEKSNKAETAVDSEKLAEYQSLPQGMIVRVPVDSNGNMQTSDLEVRDYNGQAIDQNNVSDLQNYYSSAPISSTYGQRAIDASLGNVTVINPPAKSFLGAPSQYPGQIPGAKGGKGGPGQYPGQIPGAKGGKGGPGQYPGQIPGKMGPGQYPGQIPGKTGPGQIPGQFPGQYPSQTPGKTGPGQMSYAYGNYDNNYDSMYYPQVDTGLDSSYYNYNPQTIQNNYFYSTFRPVQRSRIYSNQYWAYYTQPYYYMGGSHCYFYYPRPSCNQWCGGNRY